jgi:hypothetical protein
MTKLSPKAVTLAQIVLAPVCFLATAAMQQLQLAENFILPILNYFFLQKNIPFVMIGIMFVWTYVITASLSVIAQAVYLEQGYDNNVCIKFFFFFGIEGNAAGFFRIHKRRLFYNVRNQGFTSINHL